MSDFKYELRETHQVKIEELITRSAQVLRLSSNTAEVGSCDQMQQKSDENGGSVLSKTVGDLTAISKTVGEFLLCYCKQWECSTENLI